MTTIYKIIIMTMAAGGNQIHQTFESEEARDAMLKDFQPRLTNGEAFLGIKPDIDKSKFGNATVIIPVNQIAFIEAVDILSA